MKIVTFLSNIQKTLKNLNFFAKIFKGFLRHSIVLQIKYIFHAIYKFGGGHSPKFYFDFCEIFYFFGHFSENSKNKLLSQPQVFPSPAMET